MKGFRKRLSALLVTAAMAAAVVVPAAAAGSDYTPVAAQNVKFKKILVVDADANLPAVSFAYTVEIPDDDIAGTTTTLPVYKGVGTPGIANVSYSSSDSFDSPTKVTNYKTVTKDITVTMTGIEFTEPGVYRYYIKETKGTSGVYYDVSASALTTEDDLYRTLDVYVEDDPSVTTGKGLKVTGYIMYDGKIIAAPPSSSSATSGTAITSETSIAEVNGTQANTVTGATKTDNYMNYFSSYSLTFGKVVTGNQGSRDKYFELTLELTSPSDATFTVDVSHADAKLPDTVNKATDASFAKKTNTTEISATANTAVTTKFYLQHGQYIIVKGLPVGTEYTLSEVADGYTSTAGIAASVSVINWDGTDGYDALSDAVTGTVKALDDSDTTTDDGDLQTGFTNDKQGVIPTGVLLTMTPIIVVAVVVVAGIAFFAVRNAKRKALELADADSEEEAE